MFRIDYLTAANTPVCYAFFTFQFFKNQKLCFWKTLFWKFLLKISKKCKAEILQKLKNVNLICFLIPKKAEHTNVLARQMRQSNGLSKNDTALKYTVKLKDWAL